MRRRDGRPGEAALNRGFPATDTIAVAAGLLADADAFRASAADEHPEWFGADRLRITEGRIVGAVQIETLSAIVRTKTGAARCDALAAHHLRYVISGQSQWRETIWPEVQKRTSCDSWDAIMNRRKH